MVTIFIKNNRSIIATQGKFRQKYPNRPVPPKTIIIVYMQIFDNTVQQQPDFVLEDNGRLATQKICLWCAIVFQSLQKHQCGDVLPATFTYLFFEQTYWQSKW
ncbi:unnamed protein product [Lepeophtheirus salmonis]|uniref:(salmon louse) hypothetical protein n=1 Tax=Lepeophtheirus salmonis TaxID=72036 RepID=A0A7R8HD95_LEPSM|nr:unnamed protein product [Lepeophtheirus salmonis]CAF3019079.1 unnamed protein product [Lepeophtheirus salmonis]